MKRFSRYIFHCTALLSLLLLIGSAAMWVRSYWRMDMVQVFPRNIQKQGPPVDLGNSQDVADISYDSTGFISAHGVFEINRTIVQTSGPPSDVPSFNLDSYDHSAHSFFQGKEGAFAFFSNPLALRLPYWIVCLAFAILPTIWLVRWRQWRRQKLIEQGKCIKCKYDLKSNTTGECPECGATTTEGAT